jgi:hypothetical protein
MIKMLCKCFCDLLEGNYLIFNFFSYSNCNEFKESFMLPKSVEFIYVKCTSGNEIIYKNAHATPRMKLKSQKKFKHAKEEPLSILFMGMDSTSRLNFQRAFPNLNEYLRESGWFELEGYIKVRKI